MIAEAAAISGIVAALLIGALTIGAYAARTWIGTRIQEGVRLGASKELEEYRHDLAADNAAILEEIRKVNVGLQAVQGTANAALVEGQRVAAEWRAKTADAMWREVLRLRNEAPPVLTYLDILNPDEYQLFVTRPDLRELALSLEDERAWFWNPDIEYVRPFLGEDLFLMFFVYRAWLGRVAFLLDRDVREGKVKPWFDDSGISQLLRMVLVEKEMKQLERLPVSQFHWTSNAIEGKILDRLRQVISGEVSTTEGLEQAWRVREVVEQFEAEDRRQCVGSH